MSKSHKLLYDPIHGYLKFGGNCLEIIDSEPFKRLQHIKQLGACYYVLPGATHYRFEHSLGVAHFSARVCLALRSHQPELNITDADILSVKVAGLCHDLGHGPSHQEHTCSLQYTGSRRGGRGGPGKCGRCKDGRAGASQGHGHQVPTRGLVLYIIRQLAEV